MLVDRLRHGRAVDLDEAVLGEKAEFDEGGARVAVVLGPATHVMEQLGDVGCAHVEAAHAGDCQPRIGDRHQEAVDVCDRLLQRHERLDSERLHPAVVGGRRDHHVMAVVVAADPGHQGLLHRHVGGAHRTVEQRFGERDRDRRPARQVDVAHVERALFLQRQPVDAFVLGHEVSEVLRVPGCLSA